MQEDNTMSEYQKNSPDLSGSEAEEFNPLQRESNAEHIVE